MILAALALAAQQGDGGRSAAAAQQPAQLRAVTACRQVADTGARLACYDGAVDALSQATAAGTLVVVDREDVRRTRRNLFGFSLPKLPFFSGDRSQDEVPEEIEATVRSASPFGYQRWRLDLGDNGTWQTTEPQTAQSLPRAGTKLKIKKGILGAYRITIGSGRPIAAMRVR